MKLKLSLFSSKYSLVSNDLCLRKIFFRHIKCNLHFPTKHVLVILVAIEMPE